MRVPGNTHRLVGLGRTGSGKTIALLWFLYLALCYNLDKEDGIPYVFVDIKGDDNFNKIRKACGKTIKEINYGTVPKKAGLYYLKVDMFDMEGLEKWLIKVYQQGNCGLFIDEGYAIPRMSKAFTAILTQGRALNIPCIVLYQRPVYMTKFAIAQADFFVCLDQNMWSDKLQTYEYVPKDIIYKGQKINVKSDIPRFHFLYYDVGENEMQLFKPAPPPNELVKLYKAKLKPVKPRSRIYV